LNGIYPVNIYPYNFRPKIQKKAEIIDNAEKTPQPPRDNAEFKDNRSFKNNQQFEYSSQKPVNIRTIVEDFKKTLAAIDATEEINEEVKTYLKLVDAQAVKEKPSVKLIKTNLTNAAGILDEYITETLNKPSKVVTNWIDALLLQKVDYKADESIEGIEKTVPAEKKPEIEPEKIITPENQSIKDLPVNKKLEKFYRKTEKLVDSGEFAQALINYEKILPEAQKNGDKKTETKVYLDKAYIYDISKNFPSALENYNKAANTAFETGNDKTQAICHYNIASIYDEFGKTDAAIKHYYAALSLDGQVENLKAQSHTLNDVGNIFSSEKKYKKAVDHYQVGLSLTKETNDLEGRAFLLSNLGSVFKEKGKDRQALKFFQKSTECDIKIGNMEGYSINYEHAGDIMNRNNMLKKAEFLYQKSLTVAQKLDDGSMSQRILQKLEKNNLSY